MPEIVAIDLAQLQHAIGNYPAVLACFTGPSCNICSVIKPRIRELLENTFPKMVLYGIDCDALPQVASRFGVLTIPTVAVYFDGKETARRVRNISIGELEHIIARPYHLMLGD